MNKNNCNQKESKILEKIKWLSISSFFMLSIFINYYFYEKKLFLRILIIFFLVICAISILLSTKQGKNILAYITMSKKEMQKIIWPGFKETLYTTCIVIFVTIIASLLLWGLDNVIFRLIAFIISLRF